MVEITHITTVVCPTCGCSVVVNEHVEKEIGEPRVRRHTNGGVWEHREFACGCRVDYIPNFDKEYIGRPCTHDPVRLEEKRKNTAAKAKVLEFIVDLDCSEVYKSRLSDAVSQVGG